MRYLSLDLETSGTNDSVHQVLEIGAVVENTEFDWDMDELPSFHCYVEHDVYHVDSYCLGLHTETGIFGKLSERGGGKADNVLNEAEAMKQLHQFVVTHFDLVTESGERGSVSVCGHNFTVFDHRFLRSVLDRGYEGSHTEIWDANRIRPFDPCDFYMRASDNGPPSVTTAMKRAGIGGKVQHTAVDDAKLMVELTRRHFQ